MTNRLQDSAAVHFTRAPQDELQALLAYVQEEVDGAGTVYNELVHLVRLRTASP